MCDDQRPSPHDRERHLDEGKASKEKETRSIEYVEIEAPSSWKVVLITLGVVFFLAGSVAAGVGLYVYSQLQPVDPSSEETVTVEIPMGSSVARIAQLLAEAGLIHNERLFYYYVRYQGDGHFQAGTYQLSPSMSTREIIERLQAGGSQATLRFTLPEGLTVEQMAKRLAEQGIVDEDRFLEVAKEGDFSQIAVIQEIPVGEGQRYFLEGFLFPDTYEVLPGTTEEEIIMLLLEQFEESFKEEWYAALEERGMTLYEAVTLASIIERETAVANERKIISGVLHNRLEKGMPLQADATVLYALGEHKERVMHADLEVDNPYNTYKYTDLPPGPIASPGLAALEAAIFPEEHEYLYYVTKKDGSGTHYFSKTYEEHKKYIERSLKNEQAAK